MVVAGHQIGRAPRLAVDYDRRADVLYIARGRPVPDEGEDDPRGIIWRYALEDGSPAGATIVGFSRNRWLGKPKRKRFFSLIGEFLRVGPEEVEDAIESAMKH